MNRPRLGFLYVLSIPVAAGLATVSGVGIAGFNYTGFLWIALWGGGIFLILGEKALHRDRRIAFPYRRWLPWLGLVWVSLLWVSRLRYIHVQEALQISMPVLVAMAGSLFVRTEEQLQLLMRAFLVTLGLLCLSVAASQIGVFEALGGECAARALSLTAVFVGCACLVGLPLRGAGSFAGWAVCTLLAVVTGSRMATLALLAEPVLHPLHGSRRLRAAAVLGLMVTAVAIFHTPIIQQRFFPSGSGSLVDVVQGRFDGAGRFVVWPVIWEEAWKRPWLGAGCGASTEFVEQVWPGVSHPHNDYLRVGYEFGLIGLAIFVATFLRQIVDLARHMRTTDGVTRRAMAASWLAAILFLGIALTDNPLVYHLWYMNPLFVLIGAAHGVMAGQEDMVAEIDLDPEINCQ